MTTILLTVMGTAAGQPPDIHAITWAQRFTLATPTTYHHARPARDIADGWLLELEVDPALQQPRAIGVRQLWVGSTMAVRTNWGSSCAVVWVPDAHDLRHEAVFAGSTALPDTIDARAAAVEQAAAKALGAGPVPVQTLVTETLALPDLKALMAIAAERATRCVRASER